MRPHRGPEQPPNSGPTSLGRPDLTPVGAGIGSQEVTMNESKQQIRKQAQAAQRRVLLAMVRR